MRCRHTQKNIDAFLSGEVNKERMKRIREHLSTCSLCSKELKIHEKLNYKISQLEEVKPSPQFAAYFWQSVEKSKQQESYPQWISVLKGTSRLKWGFSTAVVILVMIGAYVIWSGFENAENQKRVEFPPDIAQIEKDIDFYENFDIIKEMDILVTIENNKTMHNNGNIYGNRIL